jgi:hypothetical protein
MCSSTFDLGKPAVRELGERWPISNDLKRWRECSKHRELCVDRSRSPHPMCQFSSFPSSMAWVGLGFSVLGFGLVVVALVAFDPGHDSRALELLLVVGLGLFGTLTLRSFGRLRDSVAANSDGIWYRPRKGEPLSSPGATRRAAESSAGVSAYGFWMAPRTCPESYCRANARVSRQPRMSCTFQELAFESAS